ncbi:MAG: UDP-3-O-(3-hydroxymyristoyl)glucosamine N-acyltransferase [Proteobacteria bacterium]|nr:UDP-3-O-(3-hydroxymyristoyl)glucosamine N-acyltransferase [Pseudomonadota bacterium]
MIKLSLIAKEAGGYLIGEDCNILRVASVSEAGEGDITFLFSKKYLEYALKSKASAFIVTEETKIEGKPQIVVKNPALAQARVLRMFHQEKKEKPCISEKAVISKEAVIAENVTIMDFAYISSGVTIGANTVIYPFVYVGEDVKIGKNVKIFPHSVILDSTEIGDDTIIQPGAVLGADGFGYAFNGISYEKIPQVGKVIIGKSVEIGANTTIDRATLDTTEIKDGTKIDNLVMIAHNVKIGENTVIAGQSGVAGSSSVGNYVVMGGQVGVADHIKIGNRVMIGGRSGIMSNIDDDKKIAGIPARDYKEWLRITAYIDRLPEMKKTIDQILKRLEKIAGEKK